MTEKELFEIDLGTAEKNQTKGRKILAFIYATNMKKIRDGSLLESDLQIILADPDLAIIERLLLNGSMVTARSRIVAASLSYYTTQEKQLILNVIDNEVFTDY